MIFKESDHFFSKIFKQILSDSDASAPFIESSRQNSLLLLIIIYGGVIENVNINETITPN